MILFRYLLILIALSSTTICFGNEEKIYFMGSFEGNRSRVSIEIQRGLDLFLKQNPKIRMQVKLVEVPILPDLKNMSEEINKIITSGENFVIGLPSSEDAIAFGRITKDRYKNITLLTPFATSDRLGGFKNIISFAASSRDQAKCLGKILDLISARNDRLLIFDNFKSISGSEVGKHLMSETDQVKITTEVLETTNETKPEDLISNLKKKKISRIYFAGNSEDSIPFIREILKDPALNRVVFFASDNFGSKPILERALGDLFPKLHHRLYYVTHWDENVSGGAAFAATYAASYPDHKVTSGARKAFESISYLSKYLTFREQSKTKSDFSKWLATYPIRIQPITITIENGSLKPIALENLKDEKRFR